MWVLCIKNLESGRFELIVPGEKIDPDDPRYDEDVHIVPCHERQSDPGYLSFGIHEFTRECACHPTVESYCFNRTKVLHSEAVN